MKFKSIASRIILSVVPIFALTTILFILIVSRVTDAQMNEQINEKMRENLESASLQIRNELIRNADIAAGMALYGETCSLQSIENGELREFIMRAIPSNKNTMGGGIWYEPYALYPGVRYFGPYVHVDNGVPVYEADYADSVDYHSTDWYFNGQLSHGKPVWSQVYYDPVPGVTMITATVSFHDQEGTMLGVATADMSLEDIQSIVHEIKVGETGKAFILGTAGEYISFYDDSRGIEDSIWDDPQQALAEFGRFAMDTGQGMMTLTLDGVEQRAYFTTLPEIDWTLAIFIDSSEIAASSMNRVVGVAIVPLIGLALATVSIVHVARRLRRVANKVNSFAGLAAAGNFEKRIEVAEQDEFGTMEERLNIMMDSMEAMYAQSAAMLEVAQNANKAKSDFLSNMSHEMRTPMNAIIGMTSIAKSSADPERKDYCLNKIEDASNHLLGVINDILDMSKIEANKFDLSPAQFSFESLLVRVVNVMNFRVDEKQQSFVVRLDKNIPANLVGDDQRLAQVITNLLSNAVKFTPEQGSVSLNTYLESKEDGLCTIRIEVSDNGIGISQEQQERLFSSFEQADSSISRKFGGTGLGLAISKRIVEMMDGRIWVESEPEVGSKFSFTFRAQEGEAQEGMLRPDVRWDNLRVLMVDDSPDIREYFQEIAQQLGVSCDVAASGEEAVEAIGKSSAPYDICFVDWKMPGMDGIELSRRIKENEYKKTVVIMISATEWSVIEEQAKGVGVDKFVPKPLFPSAIADCINECIGAAGQTAAQPDDKCAGESLEGYRILLVEDVEINREIVLALLQPTKIAIDCAENGLRAVEMFEASPDIYDMIFMDIQMPELDGYQATRRIRELKHPRAGEIPIVAMTANAFREDIERCLDSGMNDHLSKPLDVEEVLQKLRQYLVRRRRAIP